MYCDLASMGKDREGDQGAGVNEPATGWYTRLAEVQLLTSSRSSSPPGSANISSKSLGFGKLLGSHILLN